MFVDLVLQLAAKQLVIQLLVVLQRIAVNGIGAA